MEITEGRSTTCVHGLNEHSSLPGTNTPIHTSTAYNYLTEEPLNYPRYFNTVNQKEVAEKIRLLEHGEFGLILSSGMAAITTVLLSILKKGDHAIFQGDIYGGTHYAITSELTKFGIEFSFTDDVSTGSFEKMTRKNTRLIYIETPSNPLLKIVDIVSITDICQQKNIVSVIDNTFASPINQTPLKLGIDVVTHSGTKYLGGHSDITCGAVVTSSKLGEEVYKTAVNLGGSLDPQTCYLLDRSLKTLALRVNEQTKNAAQLANYLADHKNIDNVYYPGLTSHPDHAIAKKQMTGFGGMLSFEIRSNPDEFVQKLTLIKPAISLGGVETTVSSPEKTSHAKLTTDQRTQAGIKPNLLRLSVGIEDVKDLIADLDLALNS